MVCLSCGTENRPGRKFCARCAAPLTNVCPTCESPNQAGELFCGECATPLAILPAKPDATAPAHVAELRLVTVLFAWAVGPDVPEARQAAEEAPAVFERVRAKVYLERLHAALELSRRAGATLIAMRSPE